MKNTFQKYSLPIKLGGKDIYSFLEKYFSSYRTDLDALLEGNYLNKSNYSDLVKTKKLITAFSQDILEAIDLYFQGYISESYIVFSKRMDEIQGSLIYKEIAKNNEYRFARIRIGQGKDWKDLFHIPFDKRELVKGYRYSIAGFPSLYLAGNGSFNSSAKPGDYDAALSLAWFETGMPGNFYWSKFRLKSVEPIKILDLTFSPFSSVTVRNKVYTSIFGKKPVENFIINSLITYPLTAACSLISEGKNKPFVPEYIIPQMLLSWVRKNASCRGIAYLSNSHIEHVRHYNAFNVVLPPVSFEKKGYCSKLRSEFNISKPQNVDLSEKFGQLRTKFNKIKQFRDLLTDLSKTKLAVDSVREILSICNSFIYIYEEIRDRKAQNIEFVYEYIETLIICSQRFSTEKYHDIMVCEVKNFSANNTSHLKDCEKIWKEWKTTQKVFIDFSNFDMLYFQKNM
ncbi:MAG: hypothetical protein JNK81_00920 [Anaerolineales bacterium]|nr:hypothetical protein [Anaerolineales bacterium]